jgi:hypothetical protein
LDTAAEVSIVQINQFHPHRPGGEQRTQQQLTCPAFLWLEKQEIYKEARLP